MPDDKAARMKHIEERLNQLEESPLYDYRRENGYHAVIGDGSLDAKVMFVGEAPGENEAKQGRPFVGAAGRILGELLEGIGLKREDVYITNVVKDRPPGNRDPRPEEIALYTPLLVEQIELIRPVVIGALGRFSMDFLLDLFDAPERGGKISDLHGKALTGTASYGPVTIVPLYHPAAAFYRRELREEMTRDFETIHRAIG